MNFTDIKTKTPLRTVGNKFVNEKGEVIGTVVNDIPRFVPYKENYAKSFGWQWNKYKNNRSQARGSNLKLKETLLKRTQFEALDLKGKTILECGMGGGDDTEVLCSLPFSEIYSFDLSYAVDRAKQFINDKRVTIFQASIFEIPFPDESFDVVYCHRVLQHTPDPQKALVAICKKVKKGGVLFAHAYKKSPRYMAEWRYKYRWFTKRLPFSFIFFYVQFFGPFLFWLNSILYKRRFLRDLAYKFIPFYHIERKEIPKKELLELNKLITVDALTPWFDSPMTSDEFFKTIEMEGFTILNKYDPDVSPMWCTATKS